MENDKINVENFIKAMAKKIADELDKRDCAFFYEFLPDMINDMELMHEILHHAGTPEDQMSMIWQSYWELYGAPWDNGIPDSGKKSMEHAIEMEEYLKEEKSVI